MGCIKDHFVLDGERGYGFSITLASGVYEHFHFFDPEYIPENWEENFARIAKNYTLPQVQIPWTKEQKSQAFAFDTLYLISGICLLICLASFAFFIFDLIFSGVTGHELVALNKVGAAMMACLGATGGATIFFRLTDYPKTEYIVDPRLTEPEKSLLQQFMNCWGIQDLHNAFELLAENVSSPAPA